MASTLEQLCKDFGIQEEAMEKVASHDAEALASELETDLDSNKSNGGDTMGLTELYNDVFEGEEMTKEAAAEDMEMEKVASEYVAAGRFMARGFYNELEKIASEVKQGNGSNHHPAELHAEGAGGVDIDDDSQLAVNTEDARAQYKNVLKEKFVGELLKKKRGVNVSGQTGQDNKVGADARR